MPHLIWSPPALADVQRLYRLLALQPEAGRPVADMEPEFREWLIDFGGSGYIALYRFDGETATILAVRHQKEAGY